MNRHYKQLSRRNWEKVAACRADYKAKKISHAEYIFRRDIVLEDGYYTNGNQIFAPYFLAQMAGKPKNEVRFILETAKETNRSRLEQNYNEKPDVFKNHPVIWEDFRSYDENFNSYDCRTKKCVLPWKLTKQEELDFVDRYYITFVDPYCDGRDCTGAPFTSCIQFLRCTDRTVIIHRINYDL